jgi:hypothetical protein
MSLILYSTITGRSRAMLRVTVPVQGGVTHQQQQTSKVWRERVVVAASVWSVHAVLFVC